MYDLVIGNARVLDVRTGESPVANIAVNGNEIAEVTTRKVAAKRRVDAHGFFACPALIDAHIHIESSMLTPAEFAKEVAPFGTGAIVADPHEIANVLGIDGIKLMIDEAEGLPVSIYFGIPSCVPATSMETSGAVLDAEKVREALALPRVVALGEVMDFPGAIAKEPDITKKIQYAKEKHLRVEGHCPGLAGPTLELYVSAGAESDHESTTAEEAIEKWQKGMHLHIREGSTAKNMAEILPHLPAAAFKRCTFATDDKEAEDLAHGHIDALVRKAISLGLPPLEAVRMATLNAARYFGLEKHGALEAGKYADIILVKDLKKFDVAKVFLKGKEVKSSDFRRIEYPKTATASVHLPPLEEIREKLRIEPQGQKVRVIGVVPGQIVTESLTDYLPLGKHVQKIVVVERHGVNGNVAVGYVKGFELEKGALGTTVAHDSHNVIVVGTNDEDILKAIEKLGRMQGGLVVVDGKVKGVLELKLAGLMSVKGRREVEAGIRKVEREAHKLGCTLPAPFMTLSFMALPVIPKLKITDRGLVENFRFVGLFVR